MVPVPEHQIGASISIVVDLMDTTLRPGIVSISIGSADSLHLGRSADFHFLGERAAAHLDEHPEALGVWHHQIVAPINVQIPSDVYMRNFTAARGLEVRGNHHQWVFRCRVGIEPVQATLLVHD